MFVVPPLLIYVIIIKYVCYNLKFGKMTGELNLWKFGFMDVNLFSNLIK